MVDVDGSPIVLHVHEANIQDGDGAPDLIAVVAKTKDSKGFTVLYRHWVVEWTFAWMGRCRRLAKDFERSEISLLAWATPAACRFMMRRVAQQACVIHAAYTA